MIREVTQEDLDNWDKKNQIKENIEKLPAYRGEKRTKNDIRTSRNVKEGDIYYVKEDNKPYIVTKKEGQIVQISPLDETATVSAGISVYEMNKSIIEKEPLFNFKDNEKYNELNDKLIDWFSDNAADFYMFYGKFLSYFTILQDLGETNFKETPLQGIKEILRPVGEIISIDIDTNSADKMLEIWIRTRDSAAELIYLFDYTKGIIII